MAGMVAGIEEMERAGFVPGRFQDGEIVDRKKFERYKTAAQEMKGRHPDFDIAVLLAPTNEFDDRSPLPENRVRFCFRHEDGSRIMDFVGPDSSEEDKRTRAYISELYQLEFSADLEERFRLREQDPKSPEPTDI